MEQTQPTKESRFICYLALRDSEFPTADKLAVAIMRYFPRAVAQLGEPIVRGPILESERGFLISFGENVYAIMFVPHPLPHNAWQRAVELDRLWPKAHETMQLQSAHIIVSNVSTASSHSEAIKMASATTLISATLAKLTSTVALVWSTANTIIEPQHFDSAARAIEKKKIPIEVWTGATWLGGPTTYKEMGTLGVITSGLFPFIGREIEFLPATLLPLEIAELVYGAASYLLTYGPILRSGEIISAKNRSKMLATLKPQGQRPGLPIIQLEVQSDNIAKSQGRRLPGLGG